MNPKLAIALLVVCAPGWAQQAPASKPAAPASPAEAVRSGEPDVKHSVIEDRGSRIEELRIRGDTQRIVVTPKVGLHKSYEILTGDASRDAFDGTGGARSSAGKRVWNVLNF